LLKFYLKSILCYLKIIKKIKLNVKKERISTIMCFFLIIEIVSVKFLELKLFLKKKF